MKWTKELPKQNGFYWIKWRDYAPFVDYLHVSEQGEVYSSHSLETVFYSDYNDKEYSYSDSPIQQPE